MARGAGRRAAPGRRGQRAGGQPGRRGARPGDAGQFRLAGAAARRRRRTGAAGPGTRCAAASTPPSAPRCWPPPGLRSRRSTGYACWPTWCPAPSPTPTRRRCSRSSWPLRPCRRTGTSPPSCTCWPAADEPTRPAVAPSYGDGSLADVLPSALAVLGVPGSPTRSGLAAPARRGTPDRGAAGRRAGLAPAARRCAPNAPGARRDPRRLGRRDRPPPASRPPPRPAWSASAPGRARARTACWASPLTCPAPTGCSTTSQWADDPDPLRWQPVPPLLRRRGAAGHRRHGGEPARVRRQRADRGRPAGARLPCRRPASTSWPSGMLTALRRRRRRPGLRLPPDLDQTGHGTGFDSAQWRDAAAEVDRLLARLVDGLPPGRRAAGHRRPRPARRPGRPPLRPGRRPAAARRA